MPYRVLILDNRYPDYKQEESVLLPIGAQITIEKSVDPNVIIPLVKGIDGIITNLTPVTAQIIAAMDKCRCVSRYGVGYDNVDTQALKQRGIFLANVPNFCFEEVSDQALALWIDAVRRVSMKDRLVRQGQWNLVNHAKIHRTVGKTFGFVGFGGIARTLHRKLAGFNFGRVLVYDPFLKPEIATQLNVKLVDLNELCRQSDYISVHALLTPQTRGMIGADQFNLMKPTAVIINTSRGPLINETALFDALKNNRIAWAGLDVFEKEPLPPESPLRSLSNITMTDHAGWYSEESMVELKTTAAQNLADTFLNGKPRFVVTA